jgi:hypothetical protein
MGCYVNPSESTKEAWLEDNAKRRGVIAGGAGAIPKYSDFPAGTMPVVLVDNGPFRAAAVAFCESEYEEFIRLDDSRPRIIFEAKVDDLLKVSDLKDYM